MRACVVRDVNAPRVHANPRARRNLPTRCPTPLTCTVSLVVGSRFTGWTLVVATMRPDGSQSTPDSCTCSAVVNDFLCSTS